MIGLFDSGVGGLSILREIQRLLPAEDFVFFGDTANVPYGEKSADQIMGYSFQAVHFLQSFRPSLIVVACNTATSVAIASLRARNPDVPIVGVVPVVKTLGQETKNGRAAVCATRATLSSEAYARLKKDFAPHVQFLELALPDWVTMIERGVISGPEAEESVDHVAEKVKTFGADVMALGSTHFPFLRPLVETTLPDVRVFDSGPAVARHVVRILTANHRLPTASKNGVVTYFCSGDPKLFSTVASRLLQSEVEARPTGQTA